MLIVKDGKEGVRAFLEKRAPQFKSRVSSDLPPFYAQWIEQHAAQGDEPKKAGSE